jgi:hypothetical protein
MSLYDNSFCAQLVARYNDPGGRLERALELWERE